MVRDPRYSKKRCKECGLVDNWCKYFEGRGWLCPLCWPRQGEK